VRGATPLLAECSCGCALDRAVKNRPRQLRTQRGRSLQDPELFGLSRHTAASMYTPHGGWDNRLYNMYFV
jgi:hypothetical protein